MSKHGAAKLDLATTGAELVIMSTERKRAPTRANIFVASDVFFCHVLRIESSDLSEGQDVTSLGIKE